MAKSLVISLIGAATFAAALLVGCGDNDAKPVLSKAGESCASTAQCADGLSCVANVCYAKAPSSGGSGGSGGAPAVGPVLGGEGESCTSRRDCEDGLACFNQRCTANGMGEGGQTGTAVVPQLGDRGETCRVNGDCATGLICIPGYVTSGIGQCDVANYGIVPSGKSCVGECETAADCCQLPTAEQSATIHSCEDIANAIDTANCATTVVPAIVKLCFQQSVYCACAKNTWSCDANSRCEYNAACSVATETAKGCPSYTRANTPVSPCNLTTKKCEPTTVAATGCATDADCDKGVLPVADGALDEVCSPGECTCYAATAGCYRKCSKDIDCPASMTCDTKTTNLCVPQTGCTTDLDCATSTESVANTCVAGTCKKSCVSDHDCSGSGDISGTAFLGQVCGADGYCATVTGQCTDDSQCKTPIGALEGVQGVKAFCVTTPVLPTVTTVASAITD